MINWICLLYYFINQNVENLKEKSNERKECCEAIITKIEINILWIINKVQKPFFVWLPWFAMQSGNQVKQLRKSLMMMFTLVMDSWIEESVLNWKNWGIEKDHYHNILVS